MGDEERSDGAPTAEAAAVEPAPQDPEVVAEPRRCQYKLRILEETDRCSKPSEIGRILRREGHYSSHLTAWRKARHDGIILGLAPKKRMWTPPGGQARILRRVGGSLVRYCRMFVYGRPR